MNFSIAIGNAKKDVNNCDYMFLPKEVRTFADEKKLDGKAQLVVETTHEGSSHSVYDGPLEDFIETHVYTLHLEGADHGKFKDPNVLNAYLQNAMDLGCSHKSSISVIDENKQGDFIDQFVGELHHYL